MSRIALLALVAGAWLIAAPMSHTEAAPTAADLQHFAKGTTTLDQVTGALGKPSQTLTNDEGLTAIVYTGPAAGALDPVVGASIFASIGKFANQSAGAADTLTTFVFDRQNRLVYFRAALGGHAVATSEDGAGPLPNLAFDLSDQQSQASLAQQAISDRPRLGIQLVPTNAADEDARKGFGAAKFQGVMVVNVLKDSAAEKAGIARQDYIYLLNGTLVTSFDDVAKAMAPVKKGDTVRIRARRIDHATSQVSEQIFDVKF